MNLDRYVRGLKERATRGLNGPTTGRRSFLVLIFLAALTCHLAAPVPSSAVRGKRIVVRNDSVPLTLDYEKGRFGSGKLYFDDPADLSVDDEDNVYVLDTGNHRVQVINDKGRFSDQWGEKGEQDGAFDDPVAISVNPDSDFLVVLDQGSDRVHKFELDGTFMSSFGEKGDRKGRFEEPVDVTIDNQDYIYVLDRDRGVVLKFHHSGSFINEWGNRGRSSERLEDPVSIIYSDESTGSVYVLDAARTALFQYDRDGELNQIIDLLPDGIEGGFKPVKVETNDENEVFVLDGLGGKLIKLNEEEISVFQLFSDETAVDQPAGLAIDSENHIYVSDLDKNRIYRFQFELN